MDTPKQRMPVLAELRFAEWRCEFDCFDLAERFKLIYRTNLWGAETSQSGLGSELDATASLRHDLAHLLRSFEVTSILDLPCGDFAWMAQMELSGIRYLGADIVPDIVPPMPPATRVQARSISVNSTSSAIPCPLPISFCAATAWYICPLPTFTAPSPM
jgi:hypothetical protein